MKQTTTVNRSIGYIQKITGYIIEHYYEGIIPMPMITIQKTDDAYGHVSVGKVWTDANGNESRELNLGAGTLSRPIEETVATIVHELAHLYAMEKGINDTSNNGVYHNKKFKEIAEGTGLVSIEHYKHYGWTITEPTESLLDLCISRGWQDIRCNRTSNRLPKSTSDDNRGKTNGMGKGKSNVGNGTSSTRKYKCPHCGLSIRATREVRVICADCNELLELA